MDYVGKENYQPGISIQNKLNIFYSRNYWLDKAINK